MKTILVIDDHSALRYILSFDLQKAGYKTYTAGNGEKGILVAIEEKPDLILLDVSMPGINGFETCRRLKEKEETKNIPIIMVTAKSQEKDLIEGVESGATFYMIKPFKFQDLLERVKEVIGPA